MLRLRPCLVVMCALSTITLAVAAQQYEPLPEGTVNFTQHIAPIIFEHCLQCHGSEPTAPFPLTDYDSVRRKARNLSLATRNGSMPPALAEPDYGDIANSGRLSAQQIGLIGQWVKEGTSPGNLDSLPPAPVPSDDWRLGEPDQVIAASEPFTVPADAFMLSRNFPLALDLEQDRWLRAVALKPLPPAVLRAFLYIDASGSTAAAGADDLAAVLVAGAALQFAPDPAFGGQLLVAEPWPLPEGVAQRVSKGSSAVVQIHFQATGVEETILPQVGLYFAEAERTRRLVTLSLGLRELSIPAGRSDFRVGSRFTLPVDVEVLGVLPNAHMVAAALKAWAQPPAGDEIGLLWVKAWDYTYQRQYWYRQPVALPAGTVIEMDYVYDNSEDNFNNPNYPPVDMTWGLDLEHEMAGLNLQVSVDGDADLAALNEAYEAYRQR